MCFGPLFFWTLLLIKTEQYRGKKALPHQKFFRFANVLLCFRKKRGPSKITPRTEKKVLERQSMLESIKNVLSWCFRESYVFLCFEHRRTRFLKKTCSPSNFHSKFFNNFGRYHKIILHYFTQSACNFEHPCQSDVLLIVESFFALQYLSSSHISCSTFLNFS